MTKTKFLLFCWYHLIFLLLLNCFCCLFFFNISDQLGIHIMFLDNLIDWCVCFNAIKNILCIVHLTKKVCKYVYKLSVLSLRYIFVSGPINWNIDQELFKSIFRVFFPLMVAFHCFHVSILNGNTPRSVVVVAIIYDQNDICTLFLLFYLC